MLLAGALLPFLVGIVVRLVLLAAGKPVVPVSWIMMSFHIWVPMAVAFGLSALPACGLLALFCPGGEVTSVGWGAFVGFLATVIVAFSLLWLDTHSLIEGFALGAPMLVLILAVLFAGGAAIGGALGFAFARIRRSDHREGTRP